MESNNIRGKFFEISKLGTKLIDSFHQNKSNGATTRTFTVAHQGTQCSELRKLFYKLMAEDTFKEGDYMYFNNECSMNATLRLELEHELKPEQ